VEIRRNGAWNGAGSLWYRCRAWIVELFYGREKTLLDIRTTLMQTDSIQKRSFYLHSTIPLAVPAWFACL
jgi:hypothetical protein